MKTGHDGDVGGVMMLSVMVTTPVVVVTWVMMIFLVGGVTPVVMGTQVLMVVARV